jgi:hypothetical protein
MRKDKVEQSWSLVTKRKERLCEDQISLSVCHAVSASKPHRIVMKFGITVLYKNLSSMPNVRDKWAEWQLYFTQLRR